MNNGCEISLENALSIGLDQREKIEINGFIATYFKNHIDELEDIVLRNIKEKRKSDSVVDEVIKQYCCSNNFVEG